MVVYSNVSVAGDQEAATQVFARRERDAQALDLLLSALQPVMGRFGGEARSGLRNGLAARGAQLDQLSASESSVESLVETINEVLDAPDEDFVSRLSYVQALRETAGISFASPRDEMMRHLAALIACVAPVRRALAQPAP
jgi:hypothetical protein